MTFSCSSLAPGPRVDSPINSGNYRPQLTHIPGSCKCYLGAPKLLMVLVLNAPKLLMVLPTAVF